MHAFPAPVLETNQALAADPIAVIGMSCRFPGARTISQFWDNLRNGVESITTFDRESLRKTGVPEEMLDDPSYIPKACVIDGIDEFDAEFFGFSPQEADILDPQQRVFLECVWNALEQSGYAPGSFDDLTAVFAGTRLSTYLYGLASRPYINAGSPRNFMELLGNDKDYLASRVSYKLNLRGPSMTVQTACSTSLVAVHLACESLRSRETDMAVAGGSAIIVPQHIGFLHHEGMILSPDGCCRPFDIGANGTTFGNGAGAVVLKRLDDALEDKDTIWAVIRGNAVNNDGSRKAGYTAPGMSGQMAVITEALELADVSPDTIGYLEAHGTGTPLGDPIEVEALTRVFRKATDRTHFCSLGSVKANIGHLDSAAGIASFIKAVLVLHHKEIPPLPNFTAENPSTNLSSTPFRVETQARPWPWSDTPRRAGVSSFGIGGTNAHLVLEEAPIPVRDDEESRQESDLFVLSARSRKALADLAAAHAQALKDMPDSRLADACFTSRVGRAHFSHRFALCASSASGLQTGLEAFARKEAETSKAAEPSPFLPVFLFTGQGAQYPGMGKGLHAAFPEFWTYFNQCADILAPLMDISLHELLFSSKDASRISRTVHTQPALFALEYSLARTWMDWGVTPSAMVGHSLGEYVAACLAGIFSLEDALHLVHKRAALMDSLPRDGAMAAIFSNESAVQDLLRKHGDLTIAAFNAPENIVVSGPAEKLDGLLTQLKKSDIGHRRLAVSHAFHSRLMEPILDEFEQAVAAVPMHMPSLRHVSNLTGDFADPQQVTTSGYWRDHLRNSVRFADGVRTLLDANLHTFIEVGPHPVLSGLVRHTAADADTPVRTIASMRRDGDERSELLAALGSAYTQGATIRWDSVHGLPQAGRIPLPTYPFQRKRHWAIREAAPGTEQGLPAAPTPEVNQDILYDFAWKAVETMASAPAANAGTWRITSLADSEATNFEKSADTVCLLFAPDSHPHAQDFTVPDAVVLFEATQRIRAMADAQPSAARLVFVTSGANTATPSEQPNPEQACLCAIVRSVRKQFPDKDIRQIDLPASTDTDFALNAIPFSDDLPGESLLREGTLHVPQTSHLAAENKHRFTVRRDAAYLITGGTGGIGRGLAQWLAFRGARHIFLASRSTPDRDVQAVMKSLSAVGANVRHITCNLGNEQDVKRLFADIAHSAPPLQGIFHLAGISGDSPRDRFIQAFQAKANGAVHLHAHAPEVDAFVLFSSVTALYGYPGDTAYSAANACLDALAAFRRNAGLPGLSVNWGGWDAGMSALPGLKEIFASQGMRLLPLETGLNAMEWLLGTGRAQAAVMDVDEVLHDIVPTDRSAHESADEDCKGPHVQETGSADALVHDAAALRDHLATEIRDMLRLEPDEPDHDADLISLGLDSLMFLTLAQSLSRSLGIKVGPNELFSNSTVTKLADRLMELAGEASAGQQPKKTPAEKSTTPERKSASRPDAPFELTDIQYAYWIGRTDAMELGRVACHTYFELDIDDLDLDRFERAWNRLIERHPMLRCFFLSEGRQQILQIVPPYVISEDDLCGLSEEEAQKHLHRTRKTMSHMVHNASRWPLFEVRASRLDTSCTRIHVSFDLLIADFHSITILMRELELYYKDATPALDPLRFTFREYIQHEIEARSGAPYKLAQQYWADRLDALPSSPPLPLAKRIADIGQPRFTRNSATLPKETWNRLKELAAANGLTPSCLLLAVYAEVLGMWSASSHFCINLTLFNRVDHHPQVNNIVGDFTSVTLQEVDFRAPAPFVNRAKALQTRFWQDMEHRAYSGVRVIRELNARRDRNAAHRGGPGATMPVVFTANISGGATNQLDSLMGRLVHNESQTPQVWLDHQVFEQQGELVVMWDHVTGLFPEGMVEAMFHANLTALNALAAPNETAGNAWQAQRLCSMPSSQMVRREEVNHTEVPLSDHLLHTLFREQLAENRSRMAVSQGRKLLTYAELADRSAALAAELRQNNIGPGDMVAVSMRKGWEQVVAVLGILFAGAAFVPISPALPKQRRFALIDQIATKGKARAVVVAEQDDASLQDWPADATLYKVAEKSPGRTPLPEPVNSPDDLAYVIFTSGSTGMPKGVMISHRGAVNTILDINDRFGVVAEDSVLALSDLSFDLSIYDIFGALAAGAAIILPDAERARDPEHWRDLMFRAGTTIWNSAPPLMRMLVEYAEETGRTLSPTLRLALLSGDWIPTSLPRRIRTLAPNCRVVSLGGATEASIWSILHPVRPEDENRASIPYGRPMKNQGFHVLDADMRPCPDWVPGGLFIAGHGLAMGYLHDTEKTAASFVADPHTGQRLYRTGDLGRYLPDGTIEFLGREDFQVKIRGHRIEPGEIEAALETHPEVACCAVTALENDNREKRLVAYVQTAMNAAQAPGVLQEHLAGLLPAYMMPAAFVCLDVLPVTSNGKLDRKALPAPDFAHLDEKAAHVAPSTPTQRRLAELWKEFLECRNIGVHDDFFAVGGDSLIASRLVLRIRKEFSCNLPLTSLFEHSTIAELAQLLETPEKQTGQAKTDAPAAQTDMAGRKPSELVGLATLPEELTFAAPAAQWPAPGADLFLTGATGFLGAGVLEALLRDTDAHVFCLVRCDSDADGMNRLLRVFNNRGFSPELLAGRTTVVPGDLEQPLFGLDQHAFARLAGRLKAIIHCGARVQYVHPYKRLAPANVNGTLEALRLTDTACRTGKACPRFIHVSTSAVISPAGANGQPVTVATPLTHQGEVVGGYAQTKWVAEHLVRQAAKRGLEATIFRPGTLWGDSRTGFMNREDLPSRILEACLSIGAAPDLDASISILPIDTASKAVVALASRPDAAGTTWNLLNPEFVSFRNCVAALQGGPNVSKTFGIALLPYPQWHEALTGICAQSPDNRLAPLLPMMPPAEQDMPVPANWDLDSLRNALKDLGIRVPVIGPALLARCLEYLGRSASRPSGNTTTSGE